MHSLENESTHNHAANRFAQLKLNAQISWLATVVVVKSKVVTPVYTISKSLPKTKNVSNKKNHCKFK